MKKRPVLIGLGALAAVLIAAAAGFWFLRGPGAIPATPPMAAAEARARTAFDFDLVAINGRPLPLRPFTGDVVLLVNTASFCGYTPQYDGLQRLQTAYAARGFTVIGVPSGNFLDQEYGSNKDISDFCKAKFGIRFPLAERGDVVGPNAIPIYRWARAKLGQANTPRWNFHKYLIGRDGQPIAAFDSAIEPTAAEIRTAIEAALRAAPPPPRPATTTAARPAHAPDPSAA